MRPYVDPGAPRPRRFEPWWVAPADGRLVSRVFCEGLDTGIVLRAAMEDGMRFRLLDTAREGVKCVELDPPAERFALEREQDARELRRVLERSKVPCRLRKAGEKRWES